MIDLETLSTKTNASIIEIAAVAFDIKTGSIYKMFDALIDPKEWNQNSRDISGETILWWLNQSEEASKRFKTKDTVSLKTALSDLRSFIGSIPSPRVWGNGATFDISILQSAYEHFGMREPWSFKNIRDLRTIVDLNPEIKDNTEFEGTRHSAIDDCKHQIKYLVETLKSLNID